MFSHVTLGITDFDRAMRFYAPLMRRLGYPLAFAEPDVPWAGWSLSLDRFMRLTITRPHDGAPASGGNGTMVALNAPDRAAVDDVHAIALENGGRDEGAPGLRLQYHPDYYGCYLRDPDGNKLHFVCHGAQETDT